MTKDHIPKIINFDCNALSCFGYSGRGIAPGTFSRKAESLCLLSGDLSKLPISTVKYKEYFTREKSAFYEIAAVTNNSLKSLKM